MVSTKLALLALVFILNPYLSEACLCNGVTAATCTAPCFQCGLCNSKCCSTIFGRDDEEPLDTLDKIILPWCPAREDSEESELANVDPAIEALEKEAFVVCDSDGEPGLSWEEVSSCINDFGHLFKGLLFPEQDDFDQFDENQDGVLVFQEWKDTLSRPLNETAE